MCLLPFDEGDEFKSLLAVVVGELSFAESTVPLLVAFVLGEICPGGETKAAIQALEMRCRNKPFVILMLFLNSFSSVISVLILFPSKQTVILMEDIQCISDAGILLILLCCSITHCIWGMLPERLVMIERNLPKCIGRASILL